MAKAKSSKNKGKNPISQKSEWRKFEELVREIEKFYINNPNVKIECPDFLPDIYDGTLREVDLTIRTSVGNTSLIVAFECRDRKQAQDVTWIEQLNTKRRNLGISVLWAVSANGFTKQAQNHARRYGIKLRTLSKINPEDILTSLRMEVDVIYHKISNCNFKFDSDIPKNIMNKILLAISNNEPLFKLPDFDIIFTAKQVCSLILRDGKENKHFDSRSIPKNGESEEYIYERDWDVASKNFFIEFDGISYSLKHISITLKFGMKTITSSLTNTFELKDSDVDKEVVFTSFVIGDVNGDHVQALYTEEESVNEKVRFINGTEEMYLKLINLK